MSCGSQHIAGFSGQNHRSMSLHQESRNYSLGVQQRMPTIHGYAYGTQHCTGITMFATARHSPYI
ncbi:hypothetical protein KCP75_03545 [Salmonella enterica subsp. enterica]|nr:hypothetical protein KCP75_03545 [Salmonella enterica subsp. enterica]